MVIHFNVRARINVTYGWTTRMYLNAIPFDYSNTDCAKTQRVRMISFRITINKLTIAITKTTTKRMDNIMII